MDAQLAVDDAHRERTDNTFAARVLRPFLPFPLRRVALRSRTAAKSESVSAQYLSHSGSFVMYRLARLGESRVFTFFLLLNP